MNLNTCQATSLFFTSQTGSLVKAMRACQQPIVAAVDDVAAGSGAIIAKASYLRLGTHGAGVTSPFNRIGLAGVALAGASCSARKNVSWPI